MESTSESSVFSRAPEEITTSPVRPSGFVALALGMLSSVVLLSTSLIMLPIIAVLIGVYALRPAQAGVPLGRRFAMLGILLAVFFACWGVVGDRLRIRELSRNGERFASQWLELAGMGEWEAVVELTRAPAVRQSPKTPLKAYYSNTESRAEAMEEFKLRPIVSEMMEAGDKVHWKVVEPTLVYEEWGDLCIQVRLFDESQTIGDFVRVELQRYWDAENQVGEWKVRDFGKYVDPSS